MNEPILREVNGQVITEWYCPPPTGNTWFRVLQEEWRGNVRMIYAWKASAPLPKTRYYRCDGFTLMVVPSWG